MADEPKQVFITNGQQGAKIQIAGGQNGKPHQEQGKILPPQGASGTAPPQGTPKPKE